MNKETQNSNNLFSDVTEYNLSIEKLKAGYEETISFLDRLMQSYSEEKRKHINTKKIFAMYKSYWTVKDIVLLWLGQNLETLDVHYLMGKDPEMIPDLVKYDVSEQGIKSLTISMITDSILNGDLEVGHDVIIQNGDVFTDSPECSIRPPVFLFLIDERQKIFGGNFPLQVPPILRQVVSKQDEYNKIKKKKDGELLQCHLKKLFIDDIDAGIFVDDLVKKFISCGKLVSEGSHKYYQYSVNGKGIKISRNRLKGIALTLLPDD